MQPVYRTRTAFHYQPAQYLLLDASHPMSPEVTGAVLEVVENILTLGSSLYGGVRIPGFGVSLINKNFINILPVTPIRGNMPKFFKSFKTLKAMTMINEKNDSQEYLDLLKLAVVRILEDYKSKLDFPTVAHDESVSQFIMITIVTQNEGENIQSFLEEQLKTIPNEKLKKINVLQVSKSNINSMKQGNLVDYTQIDHSDFKLDQYFKQWLLDYDTSQEHASINFKNKQDNTIISIKCDIVDSIINPFLLPFGHCYHIQTDYFKGSGIIKFPAKYIPIYELKVISRISGTGLCESLLFGPSQRLLPTKNWQLEGHELIQNQQYFFSICSRLLDNNEYLMVATSNVENNVDIPGYFAVLPGEGSLLLRALATSELVLPYSSHLTAETTVPLSIRDQIDTEFSCLEMIEDYTPDKIQSNLYPALKKNLSQKIELPGHCYEKKVDHPAFNVPQKNLLCRSKKRRLF